MKIPAGKVFKILKKALIEWWAKDPFRESAVIAYYAIFFVARAACCNSGIFGLFFWARCREQSYIQPVCFHHGRRHCPAGSKYYSAGQRS